MTKRRRFENTPAETIKFTSQEVADYQAGVRHWASLVVVGGSEADLGRHVLLDRPVTIGRDPQNEMPLQDVGISRRHARVFRDEKVGRYLVEDLGSTNGTRLNGARLHKPTALTEADKIIVGSTVVRFAYTDELEVDFHEKVERMVGTDDLTGLEAKRRFDASFQIALRTAIENGRSLSVLMMDIDGLKPINDTHGHHMGAFVIAEVGRLIDEVLAGHGRSCRFGGDEFMAYLPGTAREQALAHAEQIRARVEQHHFERNQVVLHPTLSLGVAVHPDDGASADQLERRADEALYRAKAQGKNRVSI
ncbi:MAG TPA: GGDEF domain-containing protein [Polyangia bacterium]|nr:GGDEF domain-containing protein [Polyangia bacterium]